MLTREERAKIFADAKAIITNDHFVYAKKPDGWYHGYDYVNKDAISPNTVSVSFLCEDIAEHFYNYAVEVVVGPTTGGVILSQWTTKRLLSLSSGDRDVQAVYADEEDVLEQKEFIGNMPFEIPSASGTVKINFLPEQSQMLGPRYLARAEYCAKVGTRRIIKRGYDKIVKDHKCLIVEDVINSGKTIKDVAEAVLKAGGNVVGVGALCNRSGGRVSAETLGVPELFSLLDLNMKMFPEADCPICRERGPKSVRTDLGKGKEFLARISL